jgi:hypothetical protein
MVQLVGGCRWWVGTAAVTFGMACVKLDSSPLSQQRYREAAPIIHALARYRASHDAYPDSLGQIGPADLAGPDGAVAAAVIRRIGREPPLPFEFRYEVFKYKEVASNYLLAFRTSTGACWCRPTHPEWHCE